MKVKFHGTRGSFPVSNSSVTEFGGNTSCVSVETSSGQQIVIDCGTGIRSYGNELIEKKTIKEIFILFTHFHIDHVQGLPFFLPAFDETFTIHLACLQQNRGPKDLKGMIDTMMSPEFCPVSFDMLHADFHILTLDEVKNKLKGVQIEAKELNHPGGAAGVRITDKDQKSACIMFDNELGSAIDQSFVSFCEKSNVLIHDAQYTSKEYESRLGWGHSTYDSVMQMAEKAKVNQLIFTHHDPDHNDSFLHVQEGKCQRIHRNCLMAKEGLEILF